MSSKKKNLETSHIWPVSNNMLAENAFAITYKPLVVLPPGANSRCHICKPPKDFKSLDELHKHTLNYKTRKG